MPNGTKTNLRLYYLQWYQNLPEGCTISDCTGTSVKVDCTVSNSTLTDLKDTYTISNGFGINLIVILST
jgi:hypothetical protein